MKTTIKIDPNLVYQVEMKDHNQWVVINDVLINKHVLFHLFFLQHGATDKPRFTGNGYEGIASDVAELYEYVVEANEHIGEPKRFDKALNTLSSVLKALREMVPNDEQYFELQKLMNGTTQKEYLPSSEEALMGHFKADAS